MPEKETKIPETEATPPAGSRTSSSTIKVRKAKSFKRIRGFLTGESRKERRARKQAEASSSSTGAKKSSSTSPLQKAKDNILEAENNKKKTALYNVATAMDPDDSTIYGVQVDERSTSTNSLLQGGEKGAANLLSTSLEDAAAEKAASAEKSAYLLKVVLLLMDPETRRFELLQLEFDSNKALVADVLAQIPLSVTEEALRQQVYTGVTSRDGKEMTCEKLLSDFCQGNDVLVAVAGGLPAKECARLAKPILSDDKVISMLTASGIDPKMWKEKKKTKSVASKAAAPKDSTSKSSTPTKSSTAANRSAAGGPSKFTILLVLFFATAGLRIVHMFFSAPIQPGHVVSPGITLRKCGIVGLVPGLSKALGPRVCLDNASLQISSDKVSMYDGDDNLVWILHGNPCPTTDSKSQDDCVDGLEFKKDKTLAMGGKPIKWLETFSTTKLTPWPFAEEPVIKTWRGASHKA